MFFERRNMKDVDIVMFAAVKLGVCSERIFGLSYEYAETPKSRQFIVNQFKHWYLTDIVPQIVEDFCLDVLSNRVTGKEICK